VLNIAFARAAKGLVVACMVATVSSAYADVSFLGIGSIAGSARDQAGLTEPLLNNTSGAVEMPHDRAGGFGSGIAYSGYGNRYLMVPDRGPADGNTNYIDRFYEVDINVARGSAGSWTITPTLVGTQLMRRGDDVFTGASNAIASATDTLRFDPEGVRISASGRSLYVSDEYGPSLYEFNRSTGQRVNTIDVPTKFNIANASASASAELPPANLSGRQSNRGMEGLANLARWLEALRHHAKPAHSRWRALSRERSYRRQQSHC